MKKTLPLLVALVASFSLLMAQPAEFDFTANSAFGGIIATVEVNGNPASGTDWIAAFDENDNCAGAVQLVENGGQAFCNLLVYGNDATTPDMDEGIDAGETFTFKLWVETTGELLDHPMDIEPVEGWDGGLNGTPVSGYGFTDGVVLRFASSAVLGCTDADACNYNAAATENDGSCTYPDANYDCDGNCTIGVDCAGDCGGAVVSGDTCFDANGNESIYAEDCSCPLVDIVIECVPPTVGTFVCEDNNTQAQIIELRNRILEEAENARTACDDADNTAEIRASLSVLVDELVALVPQRTEAEKAAEIAGGWYQVWSDNPFTTVPNICFDTNNIYQIITPNGYFYNISQVNAFGSSLGYIIRGIYELGENALPVEFTDAYFSTGPLPTGIDLVALTDQAENGEIERAQVPPTPVIGITGSLGNIYVDDLLRIITDGTPASGNSDLYIMRRQATVE